MQRGEDACIGGYLDGSILWCVMDRSYGARKWGWICAVSRREVAEEEGPTYQFGWQHFYQGLRHGGELVFGYG